MLVPIPIAISFRRAWACFWRPSRCLHSRLCLSSRLQTHTARIRRNLVPTLYFLFCIKSTAPRPTLNIIKKNTSGIKFCKRDTCARSWRPSHCLRSRHCLSSQLQNTHKTSPTQFSVEIVFDSHCTENIRWEAPTTLNFCLSLFLLIFLLDYKHTQNASTSHLIRTMYKTSFTEKRHGLKHILKVPSVLTFPRAAWAFSWRSSGWIDGTDAYNTDIKCKWLACEDCIVLKLCFLSPLTI